MGRTMEEGWESELALRRLWVVGARMGLWMVVEVEVELRIGSSEVMALWKGFGDARRRTRRELARLREGWGIEVVEGREEKPRSMFGEE